MSYNEEMVKLIFGKYGGIKNIVIIPNKRKALIEFTHRLSAEKAYEDNKIKDIDDGLSVSLLVKGDKRLKKEEQQPKKNDLGLTSNNLEKISNLYNRTSNHIMGTRKQEVQRNDERQKLIQDILAQEGLYK